MPTIQTIPLSQIRTDGLQVRAETNRGHVDDLAELFGNEGVWPELLPPCVVFCDDADYWLADGHHRYQAAQEAGCIGIPFDVRQGGKVDALWFAIGANSAHGLRRTSEDKRRAVLLAFQLDPSLSDSEIARRANVSHTMAGYTLRGVRKAPLAKFASGESAPLSDPAPDHAPAKCDGPAPSTMPRSTPSPAPAPEYRTDARGRKLDVSRIGKSRKTVKPDAPVPDDGGPMATAALFDEAIEHADSLAMLLDTIARRKGGEFLRLQALRSIGVVRSNRREDRFVSDDLETARRHLHSWQPVSGCPSCGSVPHSHCDMCEGRGYITRLAYDQAQRRAAAG